MRKSSVGSSNKGRRKSGSNGGSDPSNRPHDTNLQRHTNLDQDTTGQPSANRPHDTTRQTGANRPHDTTRQTGANRQTGPSSNQPQGRLIRRDSETDSETSSDAGKLVVKASPTITKAAVHSTQPAPIQPGHYTPAPLIFNRKQLVQLRARYDQAAIDIAKKLQAVQGGAQNYDKLIKTLQDKQLHTHGLFVNFDGTDPANTTLVAGDGLDKNAISAVFSTKYPDELARAISASMKADYGEVRTMLKDAYIRGLNAAGWTTIQKQMTFPGTNHTYTSTIIPVNQEFHETFADYGQTGNSSMSPRLTDDPTKQNEMRPTNLWLTQYKTGAANDPNGKVIFEAFRSGSLAYSLSDATEDQRKAISQSKTKELLTAMVVHYLDTNPAIRDEILSGKREGDLNVLSTSLQTPTDVGLLGAEEQQVRDQAKSLMKYDNKIDKFDIMWKGKKVTVDMRLHVIAMDFGVNSAKTISKTPLGAEGVQRDINAVAIGKLFNAYKSFTGQQEVKIEWLRKQLHQGMPDDQRKSIVATVQAAEEGVEKAKGLWDQIYAHWDSGGKVYELPARIANLGYIMGHMVHFNCKSGKDRTGLMDVEAKFLAQQMNEIQEYNKTNIFPKAAVPTYVNNLQGAEQNTYRQLLFESGNLEVQQTNTGVKGYKVVPLKFLERDLAERLGDVLPLVQGLKQFTDVEQYYKESTISQLTGKVKRQVDKIMQ